MVKQVIYNMSDLLKHDTIDVDIKSKRVGKKRIWTVVADEAFMGESVTEDILGEYWFKYKRKVNEDAMDLLLDLQVSFREEAL